MPERDPDDMRTWPDWRPEHKVEEVAGATVFRYQEPMVPGAAQHEDGVWVEEADGCINIVVTDPAFTCLPDATNTEMGWASTVRGRAQDPRTIYESHLRADALKQAGLEWVTLSAEYVLRHMRHGISPHGAVVGAAASLIDPSVSRRLTYPLTALGAIKVDVEARVVEAARCAGITLFVLREGSGRFTELVPTNRVAAGPLERLRAAWPADGNRRGVMDAHHLAVPATNNWLSPNYGHDRYQPTYIARTPVEAVVVAADGARLNERVLASLLDDHGDLAKNAADRLRADLMGPRLQVRQPGNTMKYPRGEQAVAAVFLPRRTTGRDDLAALRRQRGYGTYQSSVYDPHRRAARPEAGAVSRQRW